MQSRKMGGRDKADNDNNNDDYNKESPTDTDPPESQPR